MNVIAPSNSLKRTLQIPSTAVEREYEEGNLENDENDEGSYRQKRIKSGIDYSIETSLEYGESNGSAEVKESTEDT